MENAWEKINIQLTRRANIVPDLVNVVKEYAENEILIIDSFNRARLLLLNANTVTENNQANNQLTNVLKELNSLSEKYPDLRNDEHFIKLNHKLQDIENKVDDGRHEYNKAVLSFNNCCQSFPYYLFIDVLGFKERDYFKGYPELNDTSLQFE